MMAVSSALIPSVKRLWAQAPIWKAAAVLALILSWLFLLFPPRQIADKTRVLAQFGPEATYESRRQILASASTIPGLDQLLHATPAPRAVAEAQKPTHDLSMTLPAPKTSMSPSSTVLTQKSEEQGKRPLRAIAGDASVKAGITMGQSFSKTFSVDGHVMPLPEGQWQVLADLPGHQQDTEQHQYALGRVDHQTLRGFIAFISVTSTTNPAPGFPAFPSCDASSNFFAETEINTPFDRQACWSIRAVHSAGWSHWADRSAKLGSLERAAAGQLDAMQVHLPQDMVSVEFDFGTRQSRFIGVYMFNPEVTGVAPATPEDPASSPWLLPNLTKNAMAVGFVQDRKTWGKSNWPLFKNALSER